MSAIAIRDNAARATAKKATEIIERQASELDQLRATVDTFRDLLVYLNAVDAKDAYNAVVTLAEQLIKAQERIADQARIAEQAYRTAAQVAENCALKGSGNDRRYKVAMDISRQLREIAANAPQEQDA